MMWSVYPRTATTTNKTKPYPFSHSQFSDSGSITGLSGAVSTTSFRQHFVTGVPLLSVCLDTV